MYKRKRLKPRFSLCTLTVAVSLLKVWKDRSKISTEPVDLPLESRSHGARNQQHIVRLPEEITDGLQSENGVIVKVHRHVPLSLRSCADKPYDWLRRSRPDGSSARAVMDNGAADVSGSAPLIAAPEEASDWSSSSLLPVLAAHPSLGDLSIYFGAPSSVDAADEIAGLQQCGFAQKVGGTLWMSWVTLSGHS